MNPVQLFTPTICFRLKYFESCVTFNACSSLKVKGQVYHPIIHDKQEALLCCLIAGLFYDAMICVSSDGRKTDREGCGTKSPWLNRCTIPAVDERD
jgi:hypothetical protein